MTRRAVLAFALAGCAAPPRPATTRDTLAIEIKTRGHHGQALRAGVHAGLGEIDFAREVPRSGEIRLDVEVVKLDTYGIMTQCRVKILVQRLPQQDLLGIADGGAEAGGAEAQAGTDCVEQLTENLVRTKVRALLKRRLDDKR